MAKFCKFCGTPLEEGQVCSCQASQAAPAAAPVATAAPAPSAAAGLLNKLKNAFLSYVKAPEATVQKAVNEDIKIPAIFAGINALAAFLFLWKLLGGIFGPIDEALGELGAAFGGGKSVGVTYPFFLLLLSGILLAAIFIGLSALGLFCASKLTKKALTIQQSFTVAAYNSIFPTLLLVVGILLGLIDLGAQLIVLPIALVLWTIFAVRDARDYAGLNATIAGKNLLIQTVLMVVVGALSIYLAWEIALWCVSSIEIMGVQIGDAIENFTNIFENFDITDMIGGIM